jgi:hypothetical protein
MRLKTLAILCVAAAPAFGLVNFKAGYTSTLGELLGASRAGKFASAPSRIAVAVGAAICCKASIARSARYS